METKTQFDGNSYSLGYIDCLFTRDSRLSEIQSKRYVELTKRLGQAMDKKIVNYINRCYPHLLQ